MPHDFIPDSDTAFLTWSRNFKNHIGSMHASIGLTAPQAAEYATLHDEYQAALTLARNPSTNSTSARVEKNSTKKTVKALARQLARIIRATPGVTDTQRGQLGLTVPDTELTPAPRPDSRPLLMPIPTGGRAVRVRIRDSATPFQRAKPHGVAGASFFTYVGETAPSSLEAWTFRGNATRSIYQFNLDASVPAGAKMWIAACWYNTRGNPGPMSSPISMRAPDGVSKAA